MSLLAKIAVATSVSIALSISLQASDLVKKGEKIFNTKKIGNCLACHAVNGKDIDNPGDLGPKLSGLKNYPDKYLYDKVYNPYTTNPTSAMPPFGLNGILMPDEIKAVVAYLKTIQ